MATESPFAVADYFIHKAAEAPGSDLTPMKLIKIVYIAHGWHLGSTNGVPLISEPIQAWQFGPVIESLYHSFKQFGHSKIPASPATELGALREPQRLENFLDRIWQIYSRYTGGQLSTMTHAPGTPWHQVYRPGMAHLIIPDPLITAHYRQKLNASGAATAPVAATV